jgi:hypothetical protein
MSNSMIPDIEGGGEGVPGGYGPGTFLHYRRFSKACRRKACRRTTCLGKRAVIYERARFIFECEHEHTMSELCESYGGSRETGCAWLRRYRERGLEALVELNRAAAEKLLVTA